MDSSSGVTPSLPRSGTVHDDAQLQQGAAALARQDYPAAIALLTAVLDRCPSPAVDRRARVGLVKAYQRQGQWSEAIAHCQRLLRSSHAPTRDWSRRAFKALQSERQVSSSELPAGRSAKSPDTGAIAPPDNAASPEDIETGFVPLDPSGSSPVSPLVPDLQDTGSKDIGEPSAPAGEPSPSSPLIATPSAASKQAPSKGRSSLSLPWRQAGRAQRWSPLPNASAFEQGIVSAWTLLSLLALASGLLQLLMAFGNPIRWYLMQYFLMPRWRWLEQYPTAVVAGLLLALWIASPWLLQGILQLQGAKPIPAERLTHLSPETGRLLKRLALQPRLYTLPVRSPLVLGFGLHPKLSWLVISDGLRQLDDDEAAALVATELVHLQAPTTACLTLAVGTAQIPHILYRGLAAWGNRQSAAPLRGVLGALAALCYGLFWLFRWPSLWLSRWRRRESDRLAAGLTGNPNALARALVTVSATLVAERRRYPEVGRLDGLAPLLPVDPEAALPLGALTRRALSEAEFYDALRLRLRWSCPPQYRRWLTLNRPHPPLDERLRSLMTLTTRWRLDPEIPQIDLPTVDSPEEPSLRPALTLPQMLLQTAPYWGGIAGALLGLLLWSVGGIAGEQSPLGWLWGDRAILHGFIAIGVSMGLLSRVNRYFPELPSRLEQAHAAPLDATPPDMTSLMSTLGAPVQATPIALQGKLLGQRGLYNSLGQDLLLDTSGGLFRLSYTSALGPVGNLFWGQPPYALIGRTVTVVGRFHRGATAWVDVDRITPAGGGKRTCSANHPIWSTLVAFGLALWGAWTIYWGGS